MIASEASFSRPIVSFSATLAGKWLGAEEIRKAEGVQLHRRGDAVLQELQADAHGRGRPTS